MVMLKLVAEDAVITPVALPGTVAVLGVPFTAPESTPLTVLIARIFTEYVVPATKDDELALTVVITIGEVVPGVTRFLKLAPPSVEYA
jgi:hypothetical protein